MKQFKVTIRTETAAFQYTAIAECSADAAGSAYDLFGVCSVTVTA